jgi:hypothetical protein
VTVDRNERCNIDRHQPFTGRIGDYARQARQVDAIGGVDPMNLAAELLPRTVPRVRRLLWALVSQKAPPPRTVLHWSAWRREHQQCVRRAHWHRRTQRTQRKTRLQR